MAIGIPNGAPATVMVNATPTIINPSANKIPKIRPVTISISSSSLHTTAKGHNNHGTVLACAIIISSYAKSINNKDINSTAEGQVNINRE
jgi:hypothetical protein